jgi:putative ABC transport system ATP-binding protein
MKEPVVEARNITKIFGAGSARVRALKSVSLSLTDTQLTLLMGPSGSGKTTLLSILGCMLAPDAGTVDICGVSTARADPETLAKVRRNHVGFLFQSYNLFPTLTAAENVQLALDVRGVRGRKARSASRDMLARVGLAHKISAFPYELSGGEQQRVAIARAVVANPSTIFADEPTAALDGTNGKTIMGILASIASEQRSAILVVTHDTRLTPFADRIIQIEDGSLTNGAATPSPICNGSSLRSALNSLGPRDSILE